VGCGSEVGTKTLFFFVTNICYSLLFLVGNDHVFLSTSNDVTSKDLVLYI
jgi:hypothetical protein